VAGQLHGDSLGDGSPDEVPDGRSPQVMRDPSRATGGDTGRAPSLRKTGNRLRLRLALALPDKPEEHAGRDDASALERFPLRPPRFEQRPEIRRDGKRPGFAVLRAASVKPDLPGFEVNLALLQRQHFRSYAPAGNVGEPDNRPKHLR
jgi:hypothetical protein